jgi:hypothetical protein
MPPPPPAVDGAEPRTRAFATAFYCDAALLASAWRRDLSCRSGQGDEGYWCIVSTGSHYVGPPHCLMTARKGTLAKAGVRWRLRTQRLAQAGDRASNTGCCQQAWDAGAVCGSDRRQRQKMIYSPCFSFLFGWRAPVGSVPSRWRREKGGWEMPTRATARLLR